jgi:hypothetical protein
VCIFTEPGSAKKVQGWAPSPLRDRSIGVGAPIVGGGLAEGDRVVAAGRSPVTVGRRIAQSLNRWPLRRR